MVHPLPHLPTHKDACNEVHNILAPVRRRRQHRKHGLRRRSQTPPDAASFSQRTTRLSSTSRMNKATTTTTANRDVPGCSTWSKNTMSKAVLSGHVHLFFYNRVGKSRLYCYCFLPTSFIRQGYAEMYAIEPPSEYGRNDTGKFGHALVDVYARGHRARIVPTDGFELSKGEALAGDRDRWTTRAETPLTVPLRHAWATPVDLPYNGPMEEFARKHTRNDHTLMRLQQMGIQRARVPCTYLTDEDIHPRMSASRSTSACWACPTSKLPN